jgi:type II protein arginine methyltransferase
MLTTPITTSEFHSSVLTLLSTYLAQLEAGETSEEVPLPLVPPLRPVDTPIAPNETISQLLAVTSPWIDLASPDPLIANLSRQVFNLEIAYAAFCGVGNVIIPGPKLHHGTAHGRGITQFARAVQEALNIGQYLNLIILVPMVDTRESDGVDVLGNLADFARQSYIAQSGEPTPKVDLLGTWDAWNIVRSVSKYNPRLFVGKKSNYYYMPSRLPAMPFICYSRYCVSLGAGSTCFGLGRRGFFLSMLL